MNKRILKYKLEILDVYVVRMPKGSEILTAQFQNGELMVWAMVDMDEKEIVQYPFEIIGTGNPIWDHGRSFTRKYISTVQQMDARLIWHIFLLEPVSNPVNQLERPNTNDPILA